MKKRNIFISILIFLLVGEILVRIDKKYDILKNAPERIHIKMEESELRRYIDQGTFERQPNQIRIIVIGDSFINGGGINSDNKFSKRMVQILQDSFSSEKEIVVLDVSRPNNNTWDNYRTFLHYQIIFEPHFVFWAYNFNDVLGEIKLDKRSNNTVIRPINDENTRPIQTSKKKSVTRDFINKLYLISELVKQISKTAQNELKIKGIVLPMGEFYYLTKRAYLDNNMNWTTSKSILSDVSNICKEKKIEFILYKMPEFNLLTRLELFSQVDKGINSYIETNQNITYIDGVDDFRNKNNTKFMISKYDGHPNELAHEIIAERISALIKERYTTTYKLH